MPRLRQAASLAGGLVLLALARLTSRPAAAPDATVPAARPRIGLGRALGYLAIVLGFEAVLGLAVALLVAWLGLYDVAASSGHSAIARWFLHFTMRRSVAFHAPERPVPNLQDPRLVALGGVHFRLVCAPCHGSPTTPPSPVARAITPTPPPLYDAGQVFSPDQLHWIVKHGVKMTAMPAWPAPGRDDEVWALVAFLETLPSLKPAEYARLSGGSDGGGVCARCHGADGSGGGGLVPRLAGLSPAYLAQELREYRARTRPSGFMQPVAAQLGDDQIAHLADHFGKQARHGAEAPPPDPAARQMAIDLVRSGRGHGRRVACAACHGGGESDPANLVPDLDGQPAAYLEAQLRLYRSGQRAGTSAAQAMARIARTLDDSEISAVARYFAARD